VDDVVVSRGVAAFQQMIRKGGFTPRRFPPRVKVLINSCGKLSAVDLLALISFIYDSSFLSFLFIYLLMFV